MLMDFNGNIGIQAQEALSSAFGLGYPYLAFVVENLPLQVRKIDGIIVYKADPAHPRRGEVKGCRGSEAAGSDAEHGGLAKG